MSDIEHQVCTRCLMDSSAEEIIFDSQGQCSFCKIHEEKMLSTPVARDDREATLSAVVDDIKANRKGEYDCIVGLSGGVDSSYIAYKAVQLGLKPLAVHFDNGWNSELAVKNIESIVKKLDLDLVTFVIDWEEFRDIQRSFFKANVIDIEMVTDHAIFASLFDIAKKHKIRYILSGTNYATESIMPPSWQHFKFDLRNLRAIQSRFGTMKIKNYPTISVWRMAFNHYILGFKSISLLNYMPYKKEDAMKLLEEKLGWQYYGGKHWESTFTKFYQSYLLPVKFGVDKRKCHLSDMIMNEELSREDAYGELQAPLYNKVSLELDTEYVCKKLGFSKDEFGEYMSTKEVSHYTYPSYAKLAHRLVKIHKRIVYKK